MITLEQLSPEHREWLRWSVDHFGFAIEDADETDKELRHSYTVGLNSTALPELIIFGLPASVAHPLLCNMVAEARREDGRILLHACEHPIWDLEYGQVYAEFVKHAERYLPVADAFEGGTPTEWGSPDTGEWVSLRVNALRLTLDERAFDDFTPCGNSARKGSSMPALYEGCGEASL